LVASNIQLAVLLVGLSSAKLARLKPSRKNQISPQADKFNADRNIAVGSDSGKNIL
jgi:hypothetical protein